MPGPDRRRYRVRFAKRGEEEMTEEAVDFVLTLHELASVPVVTGGRVDPVRGSRMMPSFWIRCVDKDGALIKRFTSLEPPFPAVPGDLLDWKKGVLNGYWDLIGRLVDVQWQLLVPDGEGGEVPAVEWTTYGTGRCSAFNEDQGPGQFRLEISDESWKARKHVRVFERADTTSLWPGGLRRQWRGIRPVHPAMGRVIQSQGNLHLIELIAAVEFADPGPELSSPSDVERPAHRGGNVTQNLLRWLRSDIRDDRPVGKAPDFSDATTEPKPGNFKYTKLRYGRRRTATGPEHPEWEYADYEIVSFGHLDERGMFDSLEQQETSVGLIGGGVGMGHIRVWVRARAADTDPITWIAPPSGPNPSWLGFLHAPEAPPSERLPVHIGMSNGEHPEKEGEQSTVDHPWGTNGGYIHVADLTRRLWDRLGLRYDPDNLDAIEADTSLPALAPRLGREAENPEEWLEGILAQCGLVALRDRHGRRKLADLRPPEPHVDHPAKPSLSSLPILTDRNAKNLRWSVNGRETINLMRIRYSHMSPVTGRGPDLAGQSPFNVETPGLDYVLIDDREMDPMIGRSITDVGERPHTFQAHDILEPSANVYRRSHMALQERGQHWDFIGRNFVKGIFEKYEWGLIRGRVEVGKELADQLEEGQYVILLAGSLAKANPFTRER